MSTKMFLIGAGGHGLVVLDALRRAGDHATVAVFDQSAQRIGRSFLDVVVQPFDDSVKMENQRFHVCIGDNPTRARIFARLRAAGGVPATIIHPEAVRSSGAKIGDGTFVAARAIVGPVSVLGDGVIVNHGTIVDHECVVGHYCHLAPGATLAGNVRIGDRVLVGAGANILPGVCVGDDATIGAGAVVTANIESGATYVGVPARRIR